MVNSFNKVFLGAAGGGEDLPSEDEFNRVAFLSHFEGANNGVNNAFDDSSDSNRTVNVAGEPTQGSFGPFARPEGEFGVDFRVDGTSLTVPTSTDLNLGTGDFTLECFIFVQNPEDNGGIMSKRDNEGGFGNSYRTSYRTGSKKVSFAMSTGSVEILSPVVEKGIWTHIAVVRDNGTLSIYAAGVQGGTATSNTADEGASWPFTIGSQYTESGSTPQFSFIGQISNVRFVKGTAVYSGSSFTPPTGKLTAITNTKILTCQSNRFVDNSASGRTITPTGNTRVSAFGPFLTSRVYDPAVNGASAFFDQSGDALSVASSPITASGNFTLEGWVYSQVASEQAIVGQYQGRSTGRMIITTTNGLLTFFQNGVTGGNNGTNVALGQWAHFVLQRTGSNIAFYVNGARVLNNSAANIAQDYLVIGAEDVNSGNYPNAFNGFISNIRCTSSAVYSEGTSITVPTAPYPTVTNTNLLLNMADGQVIDNAAQNNLELYGTAKISTVQKKFGNTSLLLDGNSDYASFNENGGNDIDSAENWTVEFFWRFNDKTSPQYQMILTKFNLQIYTDNGELRLAIGNGSGYFVNKTGGTTLDDDTWYHIAVVKNGTAYNEYLNGTNEGNLAASSSAIIDSGGRPWYIGTLQTGEGTYPANGYIDEVRISKFARYTSNFTAPSEPFADKGQ